ncbi:FRG domain-containing protein [Herbaspirillum frisingense]
MFVHFGPTYSPPGLVFFLSIPQNKTNRFSISLDKNSFFPIDASSGLQYSWTEFDRQFPEKPFTQSFKFAGERKGAEFQIQVETDQVIGTIRLSQRQQKSSSLASQRLSWSEFKEKVNGLDSNRFIYRGQNQTWPLRTSFHRTKRADLSRFLAEDIQTLHRRLSGQTKHVFDLTQPLQNGAFFNMLQHHGYPTPILDWSHSPYVSAFFAFRGLSSEKSQDGRNPYVRIFVFDMQEWVRDYSQVSMLDVVTPHFSVQEFMALNNDRLVPQQGIATVTNVDDIERYIAERETERGKNYLSAIDIAWNARDEVVKDLNLMGITAGSLFPGIDGACEDVKERLFNI